MKILLHCIMFSFFLLLLESCKKEYNQVKTIQLENLVWTKMEEGLTLNITEAGSEIYLTKLNQVLKSGDKGKTWNKLGWDSNIYIAGGIARNFKFLTITGVKYYIHPKILGDYLFVTTDAGLYRTQFKF